MVARTIVISVMLFLQCIQGNADEKNAQANRIWTDEKSKRTIEGYITNKHREGTSIEIRKKEGGYVWVPIDQLIKKDQDYARKWVKAQDTISVTNKVIKKGGLRVIRVKAMAGVKDMAVKVKLSENGRVVTKKVKSGKTLEFEIEVYQGYTVSGYHGKTLIDRESALKKTGLQQN